jgi:hypothetical protein
MPGSLVTIRLGPGIRHIRARALMRDARAQGLSFEFADMDLDERARLRRLLRGSTEQTPASSETPPATGAPIAKQESIAEQEP